MKFIKFIFVSLLIATSSVFAQNTTKIVIYSAPGSQVHANVLRLQNELNKQINRTFVIDIRMGAEGLIAAEYVNSYKNSKSIVLMIGAAQRWENVHNKKNLSHLTDFHLISYYGTLPSYVITGKHKNVNSFSQLLEMSKTTKVSYGITQNHPMRTLLKELFEKYGNIANVQEITYRSSAQSVADTVNENLDFMIGSPDNVRQLVNENKLKFISSLDFTFSVDKNVKTLRTENILIENIEKYSAHIFLWSNNNFNLDEIEQIKKVIEHVITSENTIGMISDINHLVNSSQLLQRILE